MNPVHNFFIYLALFPRSARSPVKALDLIGQSNSSYCFVLKFNFKRKTFGPAGNRNTNQESGLTVIEFW